MLRSNRLTWLAGLTVLVAFGTLLDAVGVLDYGTFLQGKLKGHVEDSFGNLHPTIPPNITSHCCVPASVHHVEKLVEQWDSSRFLKGHPTKLFRGVLIPSVGVVARCLIQPWQITFLIINLTLLAGRLKLLGSVRSPFFFFAWALTLNLLANQFMSYVRPLSYPPVQ